MKSTTFSIVFILLTNLFITESFIIKGDLTYNNKKSVHSLPIALSYEDVNDIEKRQLNRRQRAARQRRRRRRNQLLNNLQINVNVLRTQLSNLEVAISSRLRTVVTVGG